MKTMKKMLVMLLVAVMILSVPTAQAKTYKANKVTAKQVVTELKKSTGLIKKITKADGIEELLKTPNFYRSKINFTDKEYKDIYCTVEVFRDIYDAVYRQAQISTLSYLYGTLQQEEDVPLQAYRFKNVVIRVGSKMPLDRVMKYYNALMKIVK